MRRSRERRYAPRHSRRRSKDKAAAQDRLGMILLTVGVLAVAGVGIAFAATRHATDIDRTTGCPKGNRAPAAHTLILVDATDKLQGQQLATARSVIQTEYMWLPTGGQLTVRSIVAKPEDASEIVICRLDDGSHTNSWTNNPKAVKHRFDQTVGTKLHALYSRLETAPVQDASPILEAASATLDRPDFASNVAQRRLVIISDFAQHSAIASDYGAGHPLDRHARDYLSRNLSGVTVRLHYIARPELRDLQTEKHRSFWTGYFRDQGAADVSLGTGVLLDGDSNKETWIG